MTELITIFESTSKTYKNPISPFGDKTFILETLIATNNLEMYSIICSNCILNLPIVTSKPLRAFRRKTDLEKLYNKTVSYIILDIDEVKSEFDKQVILEHFKN